MSDKVIMINLNPDGTVPLRTVIDTLKKYDPDTPYIIQREESGYGYIGIYASDKSLYYLAPAANFITYKEAEYISWEDFVERSLDDAVDLDKAVVLCVIIHDKYVDNESNTIKKYNQILVTYEKAIIDFHKEHKLTFNSDCVTRMIKYIEDNNDSANLHVIRGDILWVDINIE